MKTFNYEVSGCHNCPHNTRELLCSKSVFAAKADYETLSMQNYFILTKTCPEYTKANNGWNKCSEGMPELEFVDADWRLSKQCLVSNGADQMLAWLHVSDYGTVWQGAAHLPNITHWKYTDLP